MKKTRIILILFTLSGFIFNNIALSWDNKTTHIQLSEYAVKNSVMAENKGDYLNKLGFEGEIREEFKINGVKKSVSNWIAEGADLEDKSDFGFPLFGTTRSVNHFHNPLRPWSQAGLAGAYFQKGSA